MSSDVYIGFCPDNTLSSPIHHCAKCQSERLGHLGTMTYFGIDTLRELRLIPERQITLDWVRYALPIFEALSRICEADQKMTPEEFVAAFGYMGPDGIDWEDRTYPDEVQGYLRDYPGQYWSVWVD